jgi:NAD(P)-dependent dehydrogenase (short-subunit alcohol dehydrogenase family)
MAVNVTANWRLIRSLDPLLRRSDAGRAIFVTSGVSRRVVPYWGAYAASKAALDMLVGVYAAEVAHTQVRVNLFNPGPIRTAAPGLPGEDRPRTPRGCRDLIRWRCPHPDQQWVAAGVGPPQFRFSSTTARRVASPGRRRA